MAWEWSHTNEAYQNAERNLYDLPVKELIVIAAEWDASKPGSYGDYSLSGSFDTKRYKREFAHLNAMVGRGRMTAGDIAERIWPKMESFATCDNGGFNAYTCPYGCHTVSFDREGKDNDTD